MRDQPSWTAQSVAMEILMIAEDKRYRYLVPDGLKEATMAILKTIPGLRGKLAVFSAYPGLHRLLSLVERFINPNKALYLALRKHWIEEQVRRYLDNGISQVVILGAGFDTLSYRLHREFSDVIWFEVDHPATQKVKKAGLCHDGHLGSNLEFLTCDLSLDTRLEGLASHPLFDSRVQTLYVAEGLLAYLGRETTANMLRAAQEMSEAGSRLIGTMNASDRCINLLINLKLKLLGEPYRWGLAPNNLSGFLREENWGILDTIKGQALATQYLHDNRTIAIPEDEYLFTAIKL